MARIVLNVNLVNNTAFKPREIRSREIVDAFVGDDTGAPVQSIWMTLYTDDGHEVHIAVPEDGTGEVSATVTAAKGDVPDVNDGSQRILRMRFTELVDVLGPPTQKRNPNDVETDAWPCGCFISSPPWVGSNDLDWIQCRTHDGAGGSGGGRITFFGSGGN
jgi:hypothetical protein